MKCDDDKKKKKTVCPIITAAKELTIIQAWEISIVRAVGVTKTVSHPCIHQENMEEFKTIVTWGSGHSQINQKIKRKNNLSF